MRWWVIKSPNIFNKFCFVFTFSKIRTTSVFNPNILRIFDELARQVRDFIQNSTHSECIVLGVGPKMFETANFWPYRSIKIQKAWEKRGSLAVSSSISIKYEINRIRSLANSKRNYIFEWNNKNEFFIYEIKSHSSAMVAWRRQRWQRDREETFKWNHCGDYRNVCTIIQYFSFQLVWPETRSHLRHLRAYFHNARWPFTLAS